MIISRYLIREVISALLAITVILLLAFLCQQMVRYLNYVAIGKVSTSILLLLVSFEIPYLLALLLPLGLYLGILFAYGRLYADQEMAIIQMYGYSKRRLFILTTSIAFSVSLIVLLLMTWVNPLISAKRQQLMESDEATIHLVQTLIPGRFQVSPDGRHVLYVEKLSRDHERAENIFLAQADSKINEAVERHPWTLVLADQGYQSKDPTTKDQFFVMKNGYRYEGTPGQNDYKIIQFKNYRIRVLQNDARIVHAATEALPTAQLWDDRTQPKRAAELQWRMSIAISTLLLGLLALPLSTIRPRQGRYLIFLPAVLIYILYINLLFIARRWLEQGEVTSSIGLWWVHALMLLLMLSCIFFTTKKRNRI